jgi:anti-anti-sigma regulatory factor
MSSARAARLRDVQPTGGPSVPDAGDIPTTVVMVATDGSELVVGRVDARRADLALVDALVRFQLVARREGGRLRLRNVSEELRRLLELVGLAEVLELEPRGKAELGEQLGVEEVMEAGDTPA